MKRKRLREIGIIMCGERNLSSSQKNNVALVVFFMNKMLEILQSGFLFFVIQCFFIRIRVFTHIHMLIAIDDDDVDDWSY
jgi:hypothetical protein